MSRPHILVDLGQEVSPYSSYRAPRCVEGTHHTDPNAVGSKKLRSEITPSALNTEVHQSGLVVVGARFQGKALFSSRSASFEALKASLKS